MSVYRNDTLVYVKQALESLYSQSRKADIYIQEDGYVPKELSDYLKEELHTGRIKYLGERSKNLGLAKSLNELLQIVSDKYEYIARMDADDIAVPYRLEKQYQYLQKHQDIDIVGGYIEEFSDVIDYCKTVTYPLEHHQMFSFFAKRVPLAHVTVMYRSRFFEKAGYYPTTSPTNEDTLMWAKGFKNGCLFANIPEVLVKVRVSEDFFQRRGGVKKAWSDLKDRIYVIQTLGYNISAYLYALALFFVNIAPPKIKLFLYKRLR